MNVLIIKLGAMGDVVRTTYAANCLTEVHGPSLRITWVTHPNCFDLLRFNPYVHSIATLESLRKKPPSAVDWVLSLDDEYEAAELATSMPAKAISGAFLDNGQITYSPDSAPWFDMGLISKHGKATADLMKRTNTRSHGEIFASIFQVPAVSPAFFGCSTIEADWRARRDRALKVVGFNLFAGSRWPSKEMPREESIKLMNMVRQYLCDHFERFKIVVFCDKSNIEKSGAHLVSPETSIWDCSASSLDYAAAIKACDYVFSTDSLGLHLAIAQRIPNLSYFAPTSAAEIDTFDSGRKIVSEAPDYCSYQPSADNSSLTANRIMKAWLSHVSTLASWR